MLGGLSPLSSVPRAGRSGCPRGQGRQILGRLKLLYIFSVPPGMGKLVPPRHVKLFRHYEKV